MSKVYVTQETNHDFIPAEKFGEVVFMTVSKRDDFWNIRNSGNNERLLAHLAECLKDFDPENDYIVITGSPYVTAAICLILGNWRVQGVRFLRWDHMDRSYVPLYIELRKEVQDAAAR
jgi:hypothetical protein